MIPPIRPGGKPLGLGAAAYRRGDMREKRRLLADFRAQRNAHNGFNGMVAMSP